MELNNKTIVITGAGGVLCGCFAKDLAAKGGKVALLDLNRDRTKALEEEITAAGGAARGYECNVLDKENLETVHQQILEVLGPCDILINGAGGNSPKASTEDEFYDLNRQDKTGKTFFELEEKGIEFVFHLNYLGTLLPTQVFAVDMLGRKDCSIINISSMNAYTPLTKIPAYSGAKAAVSNLTQWLAVYFSKTGIRCNAIAPGFFATAQNQRLLFDEDGTPTKRTEKILRNTPMGRFGEAQELLGTLQYLIDSDASGFVNGVVIPVDGGFSAYSGV
jgi:NAD(P)-dependent dehydrogenase (short-subunit alcohol dehydrogenase family)